MEQGHVCCVTGHRTIPAGRKSFIRNALEKAVLSAVGQGYTHFISGFASGVDLMFADIVAEMKKTYPITLEAAIPYPGRMKTPDETFQRLIGCCDVVKIHSDHLFYGTPIPACILVFKRNRPTTDVLFIDASKKDEEGNLRYIKAKKQNELGAKHIEDIVRAYTLRTEIENFSHVASLEEIQGNDYNLNIPRYVDSFEEEAPIDITAVQESIARLKIEIAAAEAQMDAYLKELGL